MHTALTPKVEAAWETRVDIAVSLKMYITGMAKQTSFGSRTLGENLGNSPALTK